VPAPALAAASAPAAASVPSAPGAGGVVVFRTKGPSWVEVTDAKGVVTLRRLLTAGETAGASGTLPLAVTVGSVNSTEVQVRGRAYDLAPVSRDNVARFEVK
jgi:cytoskeleton protein RodZ